MISVYEYEHASFHYDLILMDYVQSYFMTIKYGNRPVLEDLEMPINCLSSLSYYGDRMTLTNCNSHTIAFKIYNIQLSDVIDGYIVEIKPAGLMKKCRGHTQLFMFSE